MTNYKIHRPICIPDLKSVARVRTSSSEEGAVKKLISTIRSADEKRYAMENFIILVYKTKIGYEAALVEKQKN